MSAQTEQEDFKQSARPTSQPSGYTATGKKKSVVASTEPKDQARLHNDTKTDTGEFRRSPAPSPPPSSERKRTQRHSTPKAKL